MPDMAVRNSEVGHNFNSWPICCSSKSTSYFRRIDATSAFTANLAILMPMHTRPRKACMACQQMFCPICFRSKIVTDRISLDLDSIFHHVAMSMVQSPLRSLIQWANQYQEFDSLSYIFDYERKIRVWNARKLIDFLNGPTIEATF